MLPRRGPSTMNATSEIIPKDGLWSLVVTHQCGHTIGYLFVLKEAAEREQPRYESDPCPTCEHEEWRRENRYAPTLLEYFRNEDPAL
jgi:hypothetical protein